MARPRTKEPEVIEEAEVISEPGTDLEVADAHAPATLFRTDDPAEVVRRATAVANELKSVLRSQKLISTIGNREHVKVEGWTLCGSMLGVFPVTVWTQRLAEPEGWEARVEARTLSGQVIGAAEAQCTRDENMWSKSPVGRSGRRLEARDDYALRSMAQTRATSKALRAPLGFIVALAGFETTPAEEMPSDRPVEQQDRPRVPVPQSWAEIEKAVRACDNPDEAWALFEAFIRAASYHLFGETDSTVLTLEQKTTVAQKAAGAAVWLAENAPFDGPEFTFYTEDLQRQAWAAVLDGTLLPIPDYEPPLDPEVQASIDAAREAVQAERNESS